MLENVLDINLLRSSNHPGIDIDKGEHSFTYAILSHKGNLKDVVKESYQLNIPLRVVYSENNEFISIESDVIVESVKKAEDDDNIIIRIYEPYGKSENCIIKLNNLFSVVCITDLMESNINMLEISNDEVEFKLNPFEIVTLKRKTKKQ